MTTRSDHLDTATLRALAVKYSVDPRSLRKEHEAPGSVTGMAGMRARAALRDPMLGNAATTEERRSA